MTDCWARQSFLGSRSEEVLRALRVGIVGLGGGGSHIAQQLAHVGVGHYVLIDPDTIEGTNLNRLIGGTQADLKRPRKKTAIASRQIRRILRTAVIVSAETPWQESAECLRDCDVIFGCVDSFAERRQLEEAARRYMIPYVDIGMDVVKTGSHFAIVGQVALSMPGSWCLQCMGIVRDSVLDAEAREYGAAGGKPQVVWPNGVLASLAVGIAVQLFTPWNSRHLQSILMEFDGNTNEVASSSALKELTEACGHYDTVNALGDPWFDSSIYRRASAAT